MVVLDQDKILLTHVVNTLKWVKDLLDNRKQSVNTNKEITLIPALFHLPLVSNKYLTYVDPRADKV